MRKHMKSISFIFIFFLLFGCSNVKSKFLNEVPDFNKYVLEKLEATESNKSLIFLTAWFEKDTVQIINGKKMLRNEPAKTISQLSLAVAQVVENDKDVTIKVLSNQKTEITLTKNDLAKYKFVYIRRSLDNRKKYLVEYTNKIRYFK